LRPERPLRTLFHVIRFVVSICICLGLLFPALPASAIAKDGPGGEVRVAGTCSSGASSKLRLRSRDDGIELRFEVEHTRGGVLWHVVVVHERRVAWKGDVRMSRSSGSFELRRTLRDLPGSDEVTVRALGRRGALCRAQATLPDA
jgi:hypothetical protein